MNQFKRALWSLVLLLTALGLFGCGDQSPKPSPLELSTYADNYGNIKLRFTSIADQVTVREVILNRGNCARSSALDATFGARLRGKPPFTLKFGSSIEMTITCYRLREAHIETDQGTFSYTFQ